MKAPSFWQEEQALWGKFLTPAACLYQKIVQNRIHQTPDYTASLPVICVGNATMGGSGKTPVVHEIVALLQELGKAPAILLRGYGGSEKGPLRVEQDMPSSRVGDEALLHRYHAPTVIAADRVAGAKAIEALHQATHIILDDGLQNPSLKKSLSVLVVDGENPYGNGRIFPAGPLRETLNDAVKRVQAILLIGEDYKNIALRYQFICPVFRADIVPVNAFDFTGKPVIAFAGIGRPEKFFATLERADALLVEKISFPDHYIYRDLEIDALVTRAQKIGARPVTTRKDWVRLSSDHRLQVAVLDIELKMRDKPAMVGFLKQSGIV